MNYHVAKNGAQLGLMTDTDIMDRMARGELAPGDLCWTDGMPEWQPLGSKFRVPLSVPVSSAATNINPYAAPASNVLSNSGSSGVGRHPGFWLRFVAYFIDYLVQTVAGGVVGLMIGFVGAVSNADDALIGLAAVVLSMAGCWLYYAFMESSSLQATLGKMALGIVVTDMNGERISFGRATGRYFGQIVSAITLCIGFMMCAWTERGQCLHDMMAGCLLYKKN